MGGPSRWFDALLRPSRSSGDPDADGADHGSDTVWARYRPRLVAQLMTDNAAACADMRRLLDACRNHDMDAQIEQLGAFADAFRRIGLQKAVQFYPYLRWATARDRVARAQFASLFAEVERESLAIEALLTEYLSAPWNRDHRQRIVTDIIKIAGHLSRLLRKEEGALYPLYLPPGQYRHVGASPATDGG